MHYTHIETPIGPLLLAGDEAGLQLIQFSQPRYPVAPAATWIAGENAPLRAARAQLLQYFTGERREFDLPLTLQGTSFQKQVWRTLVQIPYGSTFSYRDLATRIGRPTAMRAVGAANGRNPLPIVLPCHRVIGANGSLTGFGGGLPAKRWLLQHEGALPRGDLFVT